MHLIKTIFSLFLALLLTSCQPEGKAPPVKLYLSFVDEVSEDFEEKIIFAINELNTEAGYDVVSLTPLSDGKPLSILRSTKGSVFAHAQYLDYNCKIEIDDTNATANNQDPEQIDLKYILLHEIGHCYGFKHTTDSSSVMYEDYVGVYGCSGSPIYCSTVTQSVKNKIQNFLDTLKTVVK